MQQQDLEDLAFISHHLAIADERPLLRRKPLATKLLSLFRADFIGQVKWDAARQQYFDPICFNRDDEMSFAYEQYYQFCDPFTKYQPQNEIAFVTQNCLTLDQLEKSEYYNDFLKPFELSHGLYQNLFHDRKRLGDIRFWRQNNSRHFAERDQILLKILAPMIANALIEIPQANKLEKETLKAQDMRVAISGDFKNFIYSDALYHWLDKQEDLSFKTFNHMLTLGIKNSKTVLTFKRFKAQINWRLPNAMSDCAILVKIAPIESSKTQNYDKPTKREAEVANLISNGFSDKEIARKLDISFWTVRSHIGKLLTKYRVKNRAQLAIKVQGRA